MRRVSYTENRLRKSVIGRPPIRKSGPMTQTERARRWRAGVAKRKAEEPRRQKREAKR